MRFGFHFMDFTLPDQPRSLATTMRDTAIAADEVGASWLSVMDHYFQMERFRTAHDPMLEGYTSLGYFAGITSRVRLGTVVTGVTYRHPGLLSKIVTTLDVVSGGRAFLGIGAAWYEREHLALGVPYPPLKERFERLEEALQIVLQMWGDDEGPYNGTYYQLAETISEPKPIQQPHPPIVIGGSGEQKTLKLVAQYADAVNLIAPLDDVEHKLDVLRAHCDAVGRDYASIEKTLQWSGADALTATDDFLAQAERMARLGIEHVHLRAGNPDPAGQLRRFGERVAPRLAAMSA